jgi:hypothetical protein
MKYVILDMKYENVSYFPPDRLLYELMEAV